MSETQKAQARRMRDGWFEQFAPADAGGLDIGCGSDPIHPEASNLLTPDSDGCGWLRWDKAEGDATTLAGIDAYLPEPGFRFRTVYASHILEHLRQPVNALRRWRELVAPGGHLIVVVPHRDLYERRRRLPSKFNREHQTFWLPLESDPPSTFSLNSVIKYGFGDGARGYDFRELKTRDEGYDENLSDHQTGEFSIEAVIRFDR